MKLPDSVIPDFYMLSCSCIHSASIFHFLQLLPFSLLTLFHIHSIYRHIQYIRCLMLFSILSLFRLVSVNICLWKNPESTWWDRPRMHSPPQGDRQREKRKRKARNFREGLL